MIDPVQAAFDLAEEIIYVMRRFGKTHDVACQMVAASYVDLDNELIKAAVIISTRMTKQQEIPE